MKFQDFRKNIASLPFFRLNDIRKIDPSFHQPQLMDWVNRGYVKLLTGEFYSLADQLVDETFIYRLANGLYEPSFISLESALAYYQVIPESVLGMTSVSSRKTKHFESRWGTFSYRSVKPVYMFGYEVIESDRGWKYKISRLEKAVLDYLYLNPQINTVDDFEGLRWDRAALAGLWENHLFEDYLEIFDKRSLDARVDVLRRYLDA